MNKRSMYVFFGMCVSIFICLQTVLAATGPPYVWAAQATLSTVDQLVSQDPENSGFGTLQVSVWEEWNGADWDIYMKSSNADGAPGTWVFAPIHPAITVVDEINPAVSVSRNHAVIGQEIHVVYQRWNVLGFWEICHTFTPYPVIVWTPPVVISTPGVSSTNPSCVYTEDQAFPGANIGTLFQVVWEEVNPGPLGGIQIMYRAYYYDPTLAPVRGYIPAIVGAPFTIRTPPAVGITCELPEIASVDERVNAGSYDYYFSIVWQEFDPILAVWNIWYVDGTTTTSAPPPPPPPPPPIGLTAGSLGTLNVPAGGNDYTDPDIAASQDYQPIGLAQSYFFHVDFVWQRPGGGGTFFDVMQCWYYGAVPTPGSAAFIPPISVHSVWTAVVPPVLIDNPTIATKLTSPFGAVPITFETWFAWEDSFLPPTDIWYRVGAFTTGPPPGFGYTMVAALRVPYVPNPGVSIDQNPELWNREDALRLNPPLTHLVFDRNPHPVGGSIEVEYIDP